jgi:preprotein translocase subunit SecD
MSTMFPPQCSGRTGRRSLIAWLAALSCLGVAAWSAPAAAAPPRAAQQPSRVEGPASLELRGVDTHGACRGDGPVLLDGHMVRNVEVLENPAGGVPMLSLRFTAAGSRRLADITRARTGRRIAFVLTEGQRTRVLACPVVRQTIDTGRFELPLSGMSMPEAGQLARRLRADLARPDPANPQSPKGRNAPSARPGSP